LTFSTLLDRSTDNMALEHFDGLELPAAADMHVHLRDGAMTELVV
jgi:dihydroorotase